MGEDGERNAWGVYGSHPTIIMFQRIQNLFPQAFSRLGLGRQAQAALICEKYRKLAPAIVHKDLLNHTIPRFYKKKILTIAVENSAWAHAIISKKKELAEALNASPGTPLIQDIKTRVEQLNANPS